MKNQTTMNQNNGGYVTVVIQTTIPATELPGLLDGENCKLIEVIPTQPTFGADTGYIPRGNFQTRFQGRATPPTKRKMVKGKRGPGGSYPRHGGSTMSSQLLQLFMKNPQKDFQSDEILSFLKKIGSNSSSSTQIANVNGTFKNGSQVAIMKNLDGTWKLNPSYTPKTKHIEAIAAND